MKSVIILLAVFVVLFSSCNPQRKIQKAKNVLNDNPIEAANYCAEKFPVIDSTIVKDSVRYDTIYLYNESLIDTQIVRLKDTVFKTIIKSGATVYITKTVTKDSIIIRRDVAKEKALQGQNDNLIVVNKDLVTDRDKWKSKAKSNGKQKWITWILLVVGIVVGIYFKKWTGGASTWVKFFKK